MLRRTASTRFPAPMSSHGRVRKSPIASPVVAPVNENGPVVLMYDWRPCLAGSCSRQADLMGAADEAEVLGRVARSASACSMNSRPSAEGEPAGDARAQMAGHHVRDLHPDSPSNRSTHGFSMSMLL